MASYLITGCSRGLGLATASFLASLSRDDVNIVFATARSHSPTLDKLVQDSAGRVVFLHIDTTDIQSVEQAVREVNTNLGGKGLDVLVNNAGVTAYTPDWTENQTDLNEIFNVNVNGTNTVTTAFLPLLRKSKLKKIINIGSSFGSIERAPIFSYYPALAYKVSKVALNGLTVQWSLALQDEGFTVVSITPGWVKTESFGGDRADITEKEAAQALVKAINQARKEHSGTYRIIEVAGWETSKGGNQYDGGIIPW